MKEITTNYLDKLILKKNSFLLLIYTNFCGTCHSARQMLEIIEKSNLTIKIYGINANIYFPILKKYKIQSIPCFLIFKEGQLVDKFYAFYSITFLYKKINQLIS